MKLHPSVLSQRQHALLRRLGPLVSPEGFYLGGGTALAIHLGHRRSMDFDWFLPSRFDQPQQWTARLQREGLNLARVALSEGTVNAEIQRVQVSFFEYEYRLLSPLVYSKDFRSYLASLDDLACMKLSAVAQRGAKKDFVDIYALLQKHASLDSMLRSYRRKFAAVDIGSVILGLSYFEDADKDRMPTTFWKVSWKEVREEIRDAVKRLRHPVR